MAIGFQVPGDLALSSDGRELLITSGAAMAQQQILVGAAIWQGSLAWDPESGLPMFDQIIVKGPDFRVLRSIFRDFLLGCAGVTDVDTLTIALDRAARRLDVTFAVRCESGESIRDTLRFQTQ
jgi:hypothetical protein